MKLQLRQYQIDAKTAVINSAIGQVIAPTGTGKSIIQGAVFEQQIRDNPGFGIYVVLTPRIMLTNQLMRDVGKHLIKNGISINALTIHSGEGVKFVEDDADDYTRWVYANTKNEATTNSAEAMVRIKDAQAEKKPLLICCTYDSVPALIRALRELDIEADQVVCDEAHYIVEKKFNENITNLKPHTKKIHFFTATQKVTAGDESGQGNGMRNAEFYGDVVSRNTPLQMIEQGYMVRPRIHYEKVEAGAGWPKIVMEAYIEHQKHVKYGAKMLVCTNGTKTIKKITDTVEFMQWCKEQEITVFAVSSALGSRINNVEEKRNVFLEKLKAHKGKAIILHINILTEGIDVPDITGVMFARNMGLTRFLQSLGRATRVLPVDAGKTTADFDKYSETWVKPYAWVIIAEVEGDDDGIVSVLKDHVRKMRLAGFEPMEEVVIAVDRGLGTSEPIKPCNMKVPKPGSTFSEIFDIYHEIEDEKKAAILALARKQLADMADDELFAAVPI
jgi:superfamily II DNA or RNA helicase